MLPYPKGLSNKDLPDGPPPNAVMVLKGAGPTVEEVASARTVA